MPPRQRRRRIIRPSAIAAVAAGAALLLTHHIHLSDARKITIVRTNNHEQDTGAAGGATVDVVDTGTAGGDMIDDSIFDPVEPDPSCSQDSVAEGNGGDNCVNGGNEPPASTIEVEKVLIDSRFLDAYGGEDPSGSMLYTLNLGAGLFDDFGIYLETYGFVYAGSSDIWIDGGLWYLINHHVQWDILFSKGFNNNIQDYFLSTGLTWRIHDPRK